MFVHKLVRFLNPSLHIGGLNKRLKWSKENAKYFSDLFDMTSSEAKAYRFEKKIPCLTKEELEKKAALLSSFGISTSEWLQYPILFRESCVTLEQQFLQLNEAGFGCINASLLSHYRKCRRKKISLLKAYGFLEKDVNVAENFISHLNPRPNGFEIEEFTDESVFAEIHHKILTKYLVWRLNTTQDAIEKFYRVNSFKTLKSFNHICENLNLLEAIGYSSQEILKHGFLLKFSPFNLKAVLNDLPHIGGMDTHKALRLYPKIVGKPPSHYLEIYQILKDANISDKCIKKNMEIFSLNPEIVRLRIDEMKNVPELRVLLNSPGILKIVRSYNEARSRLSFLQDVKFRCLTTSLLSKSSVYFNIQVREGKDVTNLKEVVALLQRLLNSECNAIEVNLCKHPYWCYVPLLEIERSLILIKGKFKFSNETIISAIQILLYSSEKIIESHQMIKNSSSLSGRNLSPLQRLNLMLYFLEKDYHFTGNGIWRSPEFYK